jgi:glutathione S-transferase
MNQPVLVGRSSSHFTRIARMFALELGEAHAFRPVFDLTSLDPADYGGNPALKVPALVDERGPLFGAENVCRELVRRSGRRGDVVLRGDVDDRTVANAEELTLNVMSAEVALLMARAAGDGHRPPPKALRGIEEGLGYLDRNVDALLAALPPRRAFSFVEVALFCAVTHLPFRGVLDVAPWARLGAFCEAFGRRESARATAYHFDAA